MAILLATDLDGTLFYPKRRIRLVSNKVKKFIQKFIDEGNYFSVVSGRNMGPANRVYKRLQRQGYAVGCNGAYITEKGKVINSQTIEPNALLELIEYTEKNYKIKEFYVMTDNDEFIMRNKFKSLFYRFVNFLWYFYQGALRNPYYVDEEKFYEAIKTGHAFKLMIMFGVSKKAIKTSEEANKDLYKKFGDRLECSWSNEFIEISPYGCSKSNKLKFLADYLKINHNDIFVVGDSGNDISMFKTFQEHSFCMSHAPLSVSKHAKYKIKRFEDIEKNLDESIERK